MATPVKISACDNELYMIATQGLGSSELIHVKSGFNNAVTDQFVLESILPKGTWQITMVGINWGGPWAFKIMIGTNSYGQQSNTGTVGVVWSQTLPPITI
ncbi:MAG TPA: hypothetical protein VF718_14680 [Allosphingosinicella sp.]|jgi:hypothetical protein